MHIDNTELDAKGLRNFGLVTGIIVVALFGLFFPWLLNYGWPLWPWIIAAALWLPAILYPKSLRPVYRGWMRFGAVVGAFNTRLILSLFFYLIMTPTGLVMRLAGRDIMRRRRLVTESYRISSRQAPNTNMEKPY